MLYTRIMGGADSQPHADRALFLTLDAVETAAVGDSRDFKKQEGVSQLLLKDLTMSLSLAEVGFLDLQVTQFIKVMIWAFFRSGWIRCCY